MRSDSSQSTISVCSAGTVLTYVVWSKLVNALVIPPTVFTSFMCSSGGTWADPRNIMCSNMCAKPCRSGRSSREPT
jgi:hypothetical protein